MRLDVDEGSTRCLGSQVFVLAFGLALVPLGLLAWRFNFVYDDAYISFRYARHFADGLGLRYNLGVDPPVEGYTNLLWILWLTPHCWIDAPLETWSRIWSLACAVALLASLLTYVRRETDPGRWSTLGTALFYGTLPPFGVWATSGLETMPFALAVFVTFERLVRTKEAPRWLAAGLAGSAAVLLRADGFVFVGLILGTTLVRGFVESRGAWRRAVLRAGAIVAVTVVLHVAWRYAYYEAWVPNTAATKVSLSGFTVLQGRDYVLEVLFTFPSIVLALVAGIGLAAVGRGRGAHVLTLALASLAYVVAVGGDFMAMGRFVVPALPFVCVLVALQLTRLEASGRTALLSVWVVGLFGTSLPGAFDVHVVPEALRARYRLPRFSEENSTQYKLWVTQKENTEEKVFLGKALRRHTAAGESIVRASIGAVGYYSDLFIYDQFGLVTPEVGQRDVPVERLEVNPKPPGHHKLVPKEYFAGHAPTYIDAQLVAAEATPEPHRGRSGNVRVRYEYYALDADLVLGELNHLRLARPRSEPEEAGTGEE